MKLIVGLGNPGRSYEATRHNVGWWVLDHLADVWRFDGWKRSLQSQVSRGRFAGGDVRLLKPDTYMNLSGEALRPYLRDERFVAADDLLVVVDDAALPVGRFRLRASGSAGGHNGLKSIEGAVGSERYARIRIGVGPPADRERAGDLADFVLDRMGKGERAEVEALYPDLVGAIETWVNEGVDLAMTRYNRRPKKPADPEPLTGEGGDEDS